MIFYLLIFIISVFLLLFSGRLLVDNLARIARFLGWREFVVAFFVVAFAGSIPNLFVGISSAAHKIPELSFGDIVGGNVVNFTLAVALAALVAKGLPAESKLVQTSSLFTIVIAFLPILLIWDGILGRGDGIILILFFVLYNIWLFSKKERYAKIYNGREASITKEFRIFLQGLGKLVLGIIFLAVAAEGMVRSASFFTAKLNISLAIFGILIIGLVNAVPEIYFGITSARKGQTSMILGSLLGAVMVPATLVLGIVTLIRPIQIPDFSPFVIARIFLFTSALFFFFFIRTGHQITKKEAFFLLFLYILFFIIEIFYKACVIGIEGVLNMCLMIF